MGRNEGVVQLFASLHALRALQTLRLSQMMMMVTKQFMCSSFRKHDQICFGGSKYDPCYYPLSWLYTHNRLHYLIPPVKRHPKTLILSIHHINHPRTWTLKTRQESNSHRSPHSDTDRRFPANRHRSILYPAHDNVP